MRIRRYRPAYFSGFDDEYAEVTSTEELLAVEWVANWATLPGFHRFSLSDAGHLMAELKGGRQWWVVVIFDEVPAWLDLPTWAALR